MACLHLPFQAKDMGALYKKVIRGDYKPIPKQYSSELHEVVDKMLVVRPQDRISISKYTSKRASFFDYFRGNPAASSDLTDRK